MKFWFKGKEVFDTESLEEYMVLEYVVVLGGIVTTALVIYAVWVKTVGGA